MIRYFTMKNVHQLSVTDVVLYSRKPTLNWHRDAVPYCNAENQSGALQCNEPVCLLTIMHIAATTICIPDIISLKYKKQTRKCRGKYIFFINSSVFNKYLKLTTKKVQNGSRFSTWLISTGHWLTRIRNVESSRNVTSISWKEIP